MSRAKPYDRNRRESGDRNPDGQWMHDLHEARTLSSRLAGTSESGSGGASPSLLNRLSGGKGKELLPEPSQTKLYGFDVNPTNSANPNAGVELLPSTSSKSARPSRTSRNRGLGPVDPGQRALVANGLAALISCDRAASGSRSGSESLSIVGAAKGSIWVRVERLARGTTAEDVKSAFAPAPIAEARITSRPNDRTVTVELELPDRDAANGIVNEYDGVAADGETLRVTVLAWGRKVGGGGGGGRSDLSARMNTAGPRREEPKVQRSGKMYSDLMEDAPPVVAREEKRQGSLASRLGRR